MRIPVMMIAMLCIATALIGAELLPGEPSLEAKLKKIVIPEVNFRNARVADVFEFLVQASREFDKEPDESRKGVNIILNLKPEEKDRAITFHAKNLSLMELLDVVTKISGFPYGIRDNVVMVGFNSTSGSKMIVRSYVIPMTLRNEIRETGAKKYFEEMGIKFPGGASASYNSRVGKLIVVNTLDNIRTLEKILAGLGVVTGLR